MANPHKGEVGFKAGEADYTIRYSANILIEVEEAFDLDGIAAIGSIMNDSMSLKALRKLFWYGLKEEQPEVDEIEAGAVMSAVGINAAAKLIADAFQAAFPQGGANGTANPPKAAGTGKISTPTG